MTIWKIFCLLTLVVPVAALVLGLLCWRCPPKGPTWALGYRSRRARASDESWLFAQNLAGQIWFWLGLVLLIAALFVCMGQRDNTIEEMCKSVLICILVQDVCLLLSVIPTEVVLLCRFDRFGRRKKPRTALPEKPAYDDPQES